MHIARRSVGSDLRGTITCLRMGELTKSDARPEHERLSRYKLEMFVRCPRCFYLDRRRGIRQPRCPPYSLNLAVDSLLKREFDRYRTAAQPHPWMRQHGVEAVPFAHPALETWRSNHIGLRVHHPASGFEVCGAVDDIWQTPGQQLHIVEYKSTSTSQVIDLNKAWQDSYKRQVEIYQWLLQHNGFCVSKVAYFVYVDAIKTAPVFAGRLEFEAHVLSYRGSTAWVGPALVAARACLDAPRPPEHSQTCAWCRYTVACEQV